MSYRDSPLSLEGTGRRPGGPRAGDRLPDQLVSCGGWSIRLHTRAAARRPARAGPAERAGHRPLILCDADGLGAPPADWPVHVLHRLAASAPGRGLTAVRPDGYIGFRGQAAQAGQLAAWLALIGAGSGIAGERASPGTR